MELGGKSPFVVFEDADLARALDAALFMIFSNNGERCTAGSRILVQKSIYAEFAAQFVERARRIRVGDPLDEATIIGPMISPQSPGQGAQLHRDGPEGRRDSAVRRRRAPRLRGGTRSECKRQFRQGRPCSPTSTTACASRRRRSSGRSPA